MTEHVHPGAPVQLTDVIDRAAQITTALSDTHEWWAEESTVLRNLVTHVCDGGKTAALLTTMTFSSLRGALEADLEALAAEQGRELAAAETAELLALAVLTEMSSLGTPGARRLRDGTPQDDIAKIMCRVRRDDGRHGWFHAGVKAAAAEPVVGNSPEGQAVDPGGLDRRRVVRDPDGPRTDRTATRVAEAFEQFQSRLEVTQAEKSSAARRQQVLRRQLGRCLDVDAVFPTGSYARGTTIRPLRDVDLMVVLKDHSHLDRHPNDVLDAVRATLVPDYSGDRITCRRRSVRVDFGVVVDHDGGNEVTRMDLIPAVERGDGCYSVPDRRLARWVTISPQVHARSAAAADESSSERWRPLVRMLKNWNEHHGNPVKPAFLIEVMAYDILSGDWTDDRPSEFLLFFTAAVERIGERWPDPAGTGPDISDVLQADPDALAAARTALRQGRTACTSARRLQDAGRVEAALSAWQTLFGPTFATL